MSLHMRPIDPGSIATTDPFELSARILDGAPADEPTNRTTGALTEIDDSLAMVESFSHLYAFRTGEGLVCFDASGAFNAATVVTSLRSWETAAISDLVYTHGHLDHVGGSGALAADGRERGHREPRVIGHEAVTARFERYRATSGYNAAANLRQFGARPSQRRDLAAALIDEPGDPGAPFLPDDTLWPTTTYADHLTLDVDGTRFELHHARGETDDHTWAWVPDRRALVVGDFVCWVFPNAGNPQKVQRYPLEWARALREMQSCGAELLLPAHGLPVRGAARVDQVLGDMAESLEILVWSTLERMNAGYTLDEIIHEVRLPAEMLERPWLLPVYDEPEFVIRNIWRLYGGWWDQDPASLKPSPKAVLAAEIAALAGGAEALAERARQVADDGDLRLACHLVEFAHQADPQSRAVHARRAEIYRERRRSELSLMAKGVFGAVIAESSAAVEIDGA